MKLPNNLSADYDSLSVYTDIVIGGQSLMKTLDAINQRLAILQPNTRLESEWAELKELGERYRAMEQDLLEKARVWGILKTPTKR